MKARILTVILFCFLCFNLQATETVKAKDSKETATTTMICVRGYVFAIVISSSGSVSITQVFSGGNAYKNLALKCESALN